MPPVASAAPPDELRQNLIRKLDSLGYGASDDFAQAMARFRRDEHLQQTDDPWPRLNARAGTVFSEVFQFELDARDGDLGGARPARLSEVYRRAQRRKLAGLAFSGGGIRSATFNLGVLQALAELRLLRDFDYLSTVSGGGYIGGWLSRWIKELGGNVAAVEEALAPSGAAVAGAPPGAPGAPGAPRSEPIPVQFLRQYSHYLTPSSGMFSADTWTLICTYARNTLLNLGLLTAWLAALFLLPRLLTAVVAHEMVAPGRTTAPCAVGLFLLAVYFMALSISRKGRPPPGSWLPQNQGDVLICICLPLMVSALLGSLAVWQYHARLIAFWDDLPAGLAHTPYTWLLLPGVVYFLVWVAGWGTAQWLNYRAAQLEPYGETEPVAKVLLEGLGHLLCAIGALGVATMLLLKTLSMAHRAGPLPVDAVQLTSLGLPLLLALFGVTITLMIGLIGRMYRDPSREWWARQGAWTFIFCLAWLALFLFAFYLPPLLDWGFTQYWRTSSAGAALTTLVTLVGLKSSSGGATGKPGAPTRLELVAKVAPYAFTLVIVGVLTTWLQYLVAPAQVQRAASAPLWAYYNAYFAATTGADEGHVLALLATFTVVALVLGWRVDINKFSLYMMYRMRLVRAYFGASNPRRSPHPFTGFDPADDPPLHTLLRKADPAAPAPLQRPYHLINAALNMVNGQELAWQTRKAAAFCLSPAYCGYDMPAMPSPDRRTPGAHRGCYRPSADYAARPSLFRDDDAIVKLGMAVAVSGAAASPNMGYHSSPPLTFLMTLFNLRLGRWSPNPIKEKHWQSASPRIGLFSILAELFGLTDTNADFLYLSDGGHFENLGLYELVRRRCRLVVAVDASCDEKFVFEDLGNAIRKCYTDLHVPIVLDARRIVPQAGGGALGGASFVTGHIQYRAADGRGQDGVLLYIKPAITGAENADVLNYSKTHPEFPHQSTADQWFDEDQFESYRTLGCQIARGALAAAAEGAAVRDADGAVLGHRIGRLALLLSRQGKPAAPAPSQPDQPRRPFIERRRSQHGTARGAPQALPAMVRRLRMPPAAGVRVRRRQPAPPVLH
ncbi:patatin-like phospholipase family protein [Rugamonas brunnea]|uniref:patatin-like phospholipase family protein n=1 Tax=Rugamonas brunnea TaxID=2758569 RepID=UPI001C710152|nr:patatin-like phospholipase family protein [Rugamonas brunnea]